MVDCSGQIVIPTNEPCEVQNQECFPQWAGGGGGKHSYEWLWYLALFTQRGGMSKIFTFHAIIGKSFTELIDHDEEDAQGIPKATLTKRNRG